MKRGMKRHPYGYGTRCGTGTGHRGLNRRINAVARGIVVLLVCMVLMAPAPLPAQEGNATITLQETVVTASRIEEPLKYSPDSVTIVTGEEIKKRGKQTVIDVLKDIPGVSIAQYGAPGGSSSIYTRGTNNAHTLIMIDGVRVGDPMSIDGKMSIADLSTDNIEKIEIVRGAQSVLYGSDAIGGAVNIITRKGKGKPKFYLSSEAGSFETFRERMGVSGATDRLDYAASVSRLDARCVSRAEEDLGNTERDYYHDTNISARIDGRITETAGIGVSVRHSESSMDYDDTGTDADKVQDTGITSISTNFDQDVSGWWQHIIKLGFTDVKREYTENGGNFESTYNGSYKLASWQHNFFIGDVDTVTAGFDYQEEEGDSLSVYGNMAGKSVNTKACFIQNKFTPFNGFSFTLGMRHDDHQTFGGKDSYKGAVAYLYEKTGTKVRGSYGTGFHAPSLYQLYDPTVGDISLKPEESKGYDIGIDQELFGNKGFLSIAYFHNKIENLIEWQWTGPGMWDGQYFNIGKAKTEGWETSFSLNPFVWLSFDAHYTYTEAKDETAGSTNEGRYLIYRAKHAGGASVNIKPLEKMNVNLNAQYTGKRYHNTDNSTELPAYTIFNLAASYDLTDRLRISGRVENLTDKKHQSVYQYGEPGIGFYGGIEVTF